MEIVMVLLVPLSVVTLIVRAFQALRVRKIGTTSRGWPEAVGCGLAAVLASTSVTHFIQPRRSGLVAIVPRQLPAPEILVTISGLAETAIATGLVFPRSRRVAAGAAIALLLVVFPANVVAAHGVDHPNAPDTALGPRTALQLIVLSAAGYVLGAARVPRDRSIDTGFFGRSSFRFKLR
jgi:uncharacterized membrane protein